MQLAIPGTHYNNQQFCICNIALIVCIIIDIVW